MQFGRPRFEFDADSREIGVPVRHLEGRGGEIGLARSGPGDSLGGVIDPLPGGMDAQQLKSRHAEPPGSWNVVLGPRVAQVTMGDNGSGWIGSQYET
jgi:hypothetical protein